MAIPIFNRMLLVVGFAGIAFFLYLTAFEARATVFDHMRWGADSLGLLIGYIALILGLGLLPISGGQMRRGLYFFMLGTLFVASSFIFGPIINHFKLLDPQYVSAFHGLGMLAGMIGYLFATYLFLSIVEPRTLSGWLPLLYTAVFVVFAFLFYPHMFIERVTGSTINFWAELASFGIGGAMLAMIVYAYRQIGPGYRRAMTMMFVATVFMVLCYPFGTIGQPNPYWSSVVGGFIHHSFMVLSIVFLLVTVFYLKRLEIYSSPTKTFPINTEV